MGGVEPPSGEDNYRAFYMLSRSLIFIRLSERQDLLDEGTSLSLSVVKAVHECILSGGLVPSIRMTDSRNHSEDILHTSLTRLLERNFFRQLKIATEDLSGPITAHCMLIPYTYQPVNTVSSPCERTLPDFRLSIRRDLRLKVTFSLSAIICDFQKLDRNH